MKPDTIKESEESVQFLFKVVRGYSFEELMEEVARNINEMGLSGEKAREIIAEKHDGPGVDDFTIIITLFKCGQDEK